MRRLLAALALVVATASVAHSRPAAGGSQRHQLLSSSTASTSMISAASDDLSSSSRSSSGSSKPRPPALNLRPIIGVLSLPGGEVSDDSSYISAGYIKWLESAGARVVPIMYDLSEEELRGVFKIVNGLLIPGGNYPLRPGTTWFKAAHLLYDLAVQENERGVYFPVHGTCLGLQLLITLISHDEYAISSVDAHDHPSKLQFTREGEDSSFFDVVPRHVLKNLEQHDIAMHNHHYGLLPQAFTDYPPLAAFFNVLAYTHDRQGVKYASVLEAKDFPFTGLAFHPEKVAFEWTLAVGLPHQRMAVDAAYFLAQAFVERARGNGHSGGSIVEEDRYLVYNWSPVFSGRHERQEDEGFFEQIYVFPAGEGYKAQGQRPSSRLPARLSEVL